MDIKVKTSMALSEGCTKTERASNEKGATRRLAKLIEDRLDALSPVGEGLGLPTQVIGAVLDALSPVIGRGDVAYVIHAPVVMPGPAKKAYAKPTVEEIEEPKAKAKAKARARPKTTTPA